ncbi:MAG: hypothetical protein SCH70_09125 [Candidatus Methanoperedens sp.]|nr:hypothetical protein [Candidatus Methanoperedens sp.]
MEKRTLGILAVVLIIVGVTGLVFGSSYSRFVYGGYPTGYSPQGMMGGDGFWSGMMGSGMMGGMMQMMGGNMLISGGVPYNPDGSLITLDQAEDIANRYLAARNNPDLELADLEEWEFNFYVEYKEKSTGVKAFQMLIDKYTGSIFPEMGPNMMWNTKYMMGLQAGSMSITEEQARVSAQQFLDSRLPGTKAESGGVFYGYYHFDVKKDDKMYGMLDVNGYSGQAWYHTWHGNFIQEE